MVAREQPYAPKDREAHDRLHAKLDAWRADGRREAPNLTASERCELIRERDNLAFDVEALEDERDAARRVAAHYRREHLAVLHAIDTGKLSAVRTALDLPPTRGAGSREETARQALAYFEALTTRREGASVWPPLSRAQLRELRVPSAEAVTVGGADPEASELATGGSLQGKQKALDVVAARFGYRNSDRCLEVLERANARRPPGQRIELVGREPAR